MSDFQTPLIFDESFDTSSLVEEHFGDHFAEGLVAKSGALLSMSAYEKAHLAEMIDYRTTGALHDPSPFGAYAAQPHYAPHMLYPSGLAGAAQESDFHYDAAADFSQHHGFVGHRASILDPRLREAPEITSTELLQGSQGTAIRLELHTPHDLFAPPTLSFWLVFGSKRVDCVVQSISDPRVSPRHYVVSGQAPPFINTGCYTFAVPMSLMMESNDGSSQSGIVPAGNFNYTSAQPTASNQSRKRKASDGSEYDLEPPSKKLANPTLQIQDQNADSFDYNQTSPYSPFVPTPTGSGMHPTYTRTASPRPSGHHYSTSSASQVSLTAPSPHTPAWSPSFTTVKTEQSPHPPLTPIPRPASVASALKGSVPKLVRTSTIQQSPPGLSSAATVSMHTQSFNPYAMYPLKATLKLKGDLDSLAKDWTTDELDVRRRLVEFERSQTGSTITASFKPVSQEERVQNHITISCIYWKEKKECYVTSVDTIYLLEALVGVRFTVEEKNRIRRNLEGFRPLTVSKSKADSEDFFKCIMGFPNPKPRNIEKDVKVFPWKILSTALKKIISKYSASYSSTASAILTPATSAYASTDVSTDYTTGSPRSDFVTSSMSVYPVTTAAGYSPSMMSGRMSAPITTASMPDLRLQMPTMGPNYNIPTNYGFQPVPQYPQSSAPVPQTMSAPASVRMSHQWDFTNFVNSSPASMAPTSASTAGYTTGIDTADFSTPVSYSMAGK